MIIKRGDIFYADLRPVVGSEYTASRGFFPDYVSSAKLTQSA